MCFFCSLIPATVFGVIGFFVLFAATRAEGGVKGLGRGLAIWILFLALMFPIMGAYVTLSGQCPLERIMEQFEGPHGNG